MTHAIFVFMILL